jgi:septal ring factor EnvC (AmiA/AmiB activator)
LPDRERTFEESHRELQDIAGELSKEMPETKHLEKTLVSTSRELIDYEKADTKLKRDIEVNSNLLNELKANVNELE